MPDLIYYRLGILDGIFSLRYCHKWLSSLGRCLLPDFKGYWKGFRDGYWDPLVLLHDNWCRYQYPCIDGVSSRKSDLSFLSKLNAIL